MTLENIYYIGQTIAVAVIVATLIAILLQGRQANRIARAELTNEVWTAATALQMSFYRTDADAAFMRRALAGTERLNEAEKDRFLFTMITLVGTVEAAHLLHARGLMERESLTRFDDTLRYYMSFPRVRRWWRNIREAVYRPPFRDFVDSVAAAYEPAEAAGAPGMTASFEGIVAERPQGA